MTYELSDELFQRDIVNGLELINFPDALEPYEEYDSVGPKFDSVAAAIMHAWSLDSSQDEDCGDAQYGNGWHALFRSERAVLHTGNSGFVSAWRLPDDADMDAEWERIEAGAVYPDEWDDGEDDSPPWQDRPDWEKVPSVSDEDDYVADAGTGHGDREWRSGD